MDKVVVVLHLDQLAKGWKVSNREHSLFFFVLHDKAASYDVVARALWSTSESNLNARRCRRGIWQVLVVSEAAIERMQFVALARHRQRIPCC